MLELNMHTGIQIQAMAPTHAKPDIIKQGKEYGNLEEELCFHNQKSALH